MGANLLPEKLKYRDLLKNKKFLILWLAQFISQLADRMFIYLLMITAYTYLHSNLGVSLPSLAFGIPALLFSLIFGMFVDRNIKKNILTFSNITRGLLVLLIPTLFFVKSSWLVIFIISLCIFTIAQLFIPAEIAAITLLVPKNQLIMANSLFMGSWMTSSVLGFGAAVPIVSMFGTKNTYFFIACLYLIAGFLISIIPIKEILHPKKNLIENVRRELFRGIKFVLRHRMVFYAMFFMGCSLSYLAVSPILAIGFVEKSLKLPPEHFGYLVTISGLGMGLGIANINKLCHYLKKYQIVLLGFAILALMFLLLAFVDKVFLSFAIIFALGFGNSLISAPLQTIIQERSPKIIHGRVFSVQNFVASAALTFPPVIAGFLADLIGFKNVFILLSVVTLLLIFLTKKLEK